MQRVRKAERRRIVYLVSDLFDGGTVGPLHPARQLELFTALSRVCSVQ